MDEQLPTTADPTPEQIATWMQRQGLQPPERSVPLASQTLLLDEQYVLRWAVDGDVLTKTATIYRRLADTTVPVPEVVAFDGSGEVLPQIMLLRRYVPGTPGSEIWPGLDEPARELLSEQLGRIVAGFHALKWPAYGELVPVASSFTGYGRWSEALMARIVRSVEMVQSPVVLPFRVVDGVVTALNDGESLIETGSRPTLVHGNLDWRKVVLRKDGEEWQIAALLGWNQAWCADAAWEWSKLFAERDRLYPEPGAIYTGYRESRQLQHDLGPRRSLYRLLIHLEGALEAYRAGDERRRARHESSLYRLLLSAS